VIYCCQIIVFLQHTWFESLRQKFKDTRRNLTGDEKVEEMKAKYGYRSKSRHGRADPLDLTETAKSRNPQVCYFILHMFLFFIPFEVIERIFDQFFHCFVASSTFLSRMFFPSNFAIQSPCIDSFYCYWTVQ
jgi:hypothetical protein